MTLFEQINTAIGAHGLWKQRLRTAIDTGRTDVAVETVRDDHRCKFGAWLHGAELSPAVKSSADYKACTELHHRFHKAAGDILSLAVAGKRDEANAALGATREFATVSSDLTNAMMKWRASAGAAR